MQQFETRHPLIILGGGITLEKKLPSCKVIKFKKEIESRNDA